MKECRCSKCKIKYPKENLHNHKSFLLCETCYPYFKDQKGKLLKKVPQWFDP